MITKNTLRNLLIAQGMAFFLWGCSTTPDNPWAGLDTEVNAAEGPLHCVMPLPDEVIGQSIIYETAVELEKYRVCSEANKALVDEHAAQIYQLKLARQGLVEAGRAQRNIADMRQQMLEDERKHHFYSSIGYWVVILGLAASL